MGRVSGSGAGDGWSPAMHGPDVRAFLYRGFDVMVCQSRHRQRELIDNFDFPKKRTAVIHDPVDIARIRLLAAEASSPFAAPQDAINLLSAREPVLLRTVLADGFSFRARLALSYNSADHANSLVPRRKAPDAY